MNFFSSEIFNNCDNRHIASEPHIRIQILTIQFREDADFFENYHGELLIIIHSGTAKIQTRSEEKTLSDNDQVLLIDGEGFILNPLNESEEIKVQFIWTPGPNPCKFCWELANRWYGDESTDQEEVNESKKWWMFWK